MLHYQKNTDTLGLSATNIGIAKGSTYSHVILFGSKPVQRYAWGDMPLEHSEAEKQDSTSQSPAPATP